MAAIEYGSYYWCVVLNENNGAGPEYVHLHSDEIAIEANGSLTFRSAGRRTAGSQPNKKDEKQEDKGSKDSGKSGDKDEKSEKGDKASGEAKDGKQSQMIYVSFAPGSWRAVYAAKLQDGSPASIEHWNATRGNSDAAATGVYPNSGAAGAPPRE
jgi:hypothetical protein